MAKNWQEGTIILQIKQFRYREDNLGYLIYGGKQAMAIDAYIKKYDPNHLFYMFEEEIDVNPYLRFNDEKIKFILKKRAWRRIRNRNAGNRCYP